MFYIIPDIYNYWHLHHPFFTFRSRSSEIFKIIFLTFRCRSAFCLNIHPRTSFSDFSLNKSVKIISSEDCVCRDPFEDLNHIHIRCSELVFNAVCQCRFASNKLANITHFDIIRKHRSTLNEISLHTLSRKSQ